MTLDKVADKALQLFDEGVAEARRRGEIDGLTFALRNPDGVRARLVELHGGWNCGECGRLIFSPEAHCRCEA